EDAHLKRIEACVLEPAGIHGLVLQRHLRLIHIAAPHGRDINRDSGFRAAKETIDRLAGNLAAGIPHGFLDPAPVEQSSLQMLFHSEQVGPYQGIAYLLKSGSPPAGDTSTATGPAKGITAH